jgi:type II pantothenate kinase
MIPFVRELIRRGTEVVVAANETPSINDITAREMRDEIFPALVASTGDAILRDAITDGRLRVVSSGNDMPVIDLRFVSREVRDEAKDADLIVLEGMGRGIETNLYAKLKVDCVKLAMVKHREVAELLGGELYDCVCKFDVGSEDL